ncbi:hypothetical protein CVS29_09730 [Arthrobacter psychrochitiniphilus]|uniref:Uncharacterized protein n=1 Tax=Arthrobacter psychrochitiniphilus TaxID=291045 RepID=A0A2V3DTB3_9MICC|nr:hypothetical protein CVS29_09730 [Arthrobacter psychrochitiniphilus]
MDEDDDSRFPYPDTGLSPSDGRPEPVVEGSEEPRLPTRGAPTPPAVVHGRIPRWLLVTASVIIHGASVWWIILPQYSNAVPTLGSLEQLSVYLVLLAVGLELASFLAYSALSASVLGAGRPSYFTLLRIDSSDVGVSHVVPGAGRRQSGTACCNAQESPGKSPERCGHPNFRFQSRVGDTLCRGTATVPHHHLCQYVLPN